MLQKNTSDISGEHTCTHKTFQHTSSYCMNLSKYGAHICNIVLFAMATHVYIDIWCSASNAT
jgi:hypothetical protein